MPDKSVFFDLVWEIGGVLQKMVAIEQSRCTVRSFHFGKQSRRNAIALPLTCHPVGTMFRELNP
jgi:hypothetical protein